MENKQLALDIKLRDDATFNNYVGFAANLIKQPEPWTFLWGNSGSGKSHLLQACCHHFEGAIYLSGLKHLSAEILQDLEQMDVICIDDLEDVMGNKQWEEALFHLMNAVKDSGKRLFISAVKPVKGLKIDLPDLSSRLIRARSIETDQLSDAQKLEVLILRANNRGFKLSEEVGHFILNRSSRDMHQLLDTLHRLEIETLAQGRRVTIPFVKQTLNL